MEITIVQLTLLILCTIGGIVVLILALRKSSYEIDYNEIIYQLNTRQKLDLETLDKGNKTIDKLEDKIRKRKRELGMKLFKK